MPKSIDITNKRFGRLTAIKRVDNYKSPSGAIAERWECVCDCGNKKIITKCSLLNGFSKSCGCYRKELRTKEQKIEIKDGYALVECANGKKFVVDKSDIETVRAYHWHISRGGYPVTNDNKIPLHKILTNTDSKQIVDHINRDKLDNRRCNLRLADYSSNGYNKRIKAGKSGEPFITLYDNYYRVVIDGKYVGGSYDLTKAIGIRNDHLRNSKAYKYNSEVRKIID